MSGLMRNVIDQVLRSMGTEERARSVEYVTDQMIATMDNVERVSLLLAIVDRVLGNLTVEERSAFMARLASQLAPTPDPTNGVAPVATRDPEVVSGSEPIVDTRA